MYEDLCAKYIGLIKDGEADKYVVLNVNASWLSTAGRNSLQQDGNRCFLGAPRCYSCAQCFWMNELSSVGFSVLKKLESIVQISPKSSSSYTLVRTILIINEIAKFLEEPQFSMPKSSMKLRSFFVLCKRRLFELVFLVWRDGTTRSLLRLLDSPAAYGLIANSLNSNLRLANKNLTHKHLGRTTMLLLHAAQLDEALLSRLLYGGNRFSLILNFKRSLEFTFNVKWKDELDYISPICYVGLMECLGFMASSCLIQNDFICCMKSLLVNMLECRTSKVYIDTCLVSNSSPDSDLDRLAYTSGRFIYQTIMAILTSKHMLQEWVHKTSCPSSTSYKPVLLRLVVTLYPLILTLSLGNCYEVTHNLLGNEVFKDLPVEFSQKIVHALQIKSRTPSNFTRVLANALAAIGDNMSPVDCRNLNACMISKEDLYDVPKIMALLCPEEASFVKQETPLPEKSYGNKSGNVISGNIPKAAQDNEMERSSEMALADDILIEKLETLRAEGLTAADKMGRPIEVALIELLVSALPWLEINTPAGIDKRLLDNVRRICNEFENGSGRVRGRAFLAVEKLCQGENKLQLIFRVLTEALLRRIEATKKSMNDWSSAAAVQPQADADVCSHDDEPDTGEAAASTSRKAVQKHKSK
ncbi:hypothetical protein VPH35_023220 [Triticum aestivum]